MNHLVLKFYATEASGNYIRADPHEKAIEQSLVKLRVSFETKNSDYYLEVKGFNEKGKFFTLLQDVDICFLGGKRQIRYT